MDLTDGSSHVCVTENTEVNWEACMGPTEMRVKLDNFISPTNFILPGIPKQLSLHYRAFPTPSLISWGNGVQRSNCILVFLQQYIKQQKIPFPKIKQASSYGFSFTITWHENYSSGWLTMEKPDLPPLILQRNKEHIIYCEPSLNFNNTVELRGDLQAACNYLMPQNLKPVINKTYKQLNILFHCFYHCSGIRLELIAVSWERFQGWDLCHYPLGQHHARPLPTSFPTKALYLYSSEYHRLDCGR